MSGQLGEASAELDQAFEAVRELQTCPNGGGSHYRDRLI